MWGRNRNDWQLGNLWPAFGGYGSSGDGVAGLIMAGTVLAGLIIIIVLAAAFWATVKAFDQVIRAWRQCDGQSRPLRIALWVWLGALALLAGVGGAIAYGFLPIQLGEELAISDGVLLAFLTIVLLVTARSTELKYRQTFLSEPENLITKVLRRPWWTTREHQAA